MIVAFLFGIACGMAALLGGVVILVALTARARLPSLKLKPRHDSREAYLRRLEEADAVLAYAFGNEPWLGTRMVRKEDR